MGSKPKLGEILVRAGVVDPDRLRAALGEQERWGKRLGQTLIEMGALSEKDLVRALASQLRLPVVQLEGKQIDQEILDLIPLELAEKHGCLPLFVREEAGVRTLYLGMEDPSDVEALDDARFRSGLPVAPVMVSPSELGGAIVRCYPGASIPPVAPEPPISRETELSADTFGESSDAAPTALEESGSSDSLDWRPDAASSSAGASPDPDDIHMVSSGEMLKALVQLLIAKGVVSRDEIAACIRSLRETSSEAD